MWKWRCSITIASAKCAQLCQQYQYSRGRSHETGFRSALTKAVNDYARKYNLLKEKDENLSGEDIREGLVAVISVKLPTRSLKGRQRQNLATAICARLRKTSSIMAFPNILRRTQKREAHCGKMHPCHECPGSCAQSAGYDAKKERNFLHACKACRLHKQGCIPSGRSLSSREIRQAAAQKNGRNRKTQAILPLRGKILNVEKTRYDKALGNAEIRAMITAFGTGIGKSLISQSSATIRSSS